MTAASGGRAAPQAVVIASRLYLASAVLGLIGLAVSLVLLPQTVTAAVQQAQGQLQGRDTAGVDVVQVATGIAIGAAVVGALVTVVLAVLTAVFARRMRHGRNWARIVLTVFAGLHLLGLAGLVSPQVAPAEKVLSLLVIAASAAAAVLTYLPASNPWFRRTLLPPTTP